MVFKGKQPTNAQSVSRQDALKKEEGLPLVEEHTQITWSGHVQINLGKGFSIVNPLWCGHKALSRFKAVDEKVPCLNRITTGIMSTYKTASRVCRSRWFQVRTRWRHVRSTDTLRRRARRKEGLQSKPPSRVAKSDGHRPAKYGWRDTVAVGDIKMRRSLSCKEELSPDEKNWCSEDMARLSRSAEDAATLNHKIVAPRPNVRKSHATKTEAGNCYELIAVCIGDTAVYSDVRERCTLLKDHSVFWMSPQECCSVRAKTLKEHDWCRFQAMSSLDSTGDAAIKQRLYQRVQVMPLSTKDSTREYRWCSYYAKGLSESASDVAIERRLYQRVQVMLLSSRNSIREYKWGHYQARSLLESKSDPAINRSIYQRVQMMPLSSKDSIRE